ncbi:MAG: DUF2156 domain-containing protein [Acutalibacteraceae bacterium]
MIFEPLKNEYINKVAQLLPLLKSNTCDFSVGGLFLWKDVFKTECCFKENAFYSLLKDDENKVFYNMPISSNIEASLKTLVSELEKIQSCVRFCTIPECYLELFKNNFNVIKITEQPEFFDYIYNSKDLSDLAGRRYSGQRNQINQFKKINENWTYENITEENSDKVMEFLTSSYEFSDAGNLSKKKEYNISIDGLKNFKNYNFFGGMLMADERVVGFSLGEKINDTVYVHIEKADRNCKGAYQMVVNQFAKKFCQSAKFINREDDAGDEGLRISKLSYHPAEISKKYIVEIEI